MIVLEILGWIVLGVIGLVAIGMYSYIGYKSLRYLMDRHKEKKLKNLKGKGD